MLSVGRAITLELAGPEGGQMRLALRGMALTVGYRLGERC